jgi:hypothetical protein
MRNFTVRVELNAAGAEAYERLHAAMESHGFVRWVEASDGSRKRLPTGDYNLTHADLDRGGVLSLALAAAAEAQAGAAPLVVVTQSVGRSWSGLRKWTAGAARPELEARAI